MDDSCGSNDYNLLTTKIIIKTLTSDMFTLILIFILHLLPLL